MASASDVGAGIGSVFGGILNPIFGTDTTTTTTSKPTTSGSSTTTIIIVVVVVLIVAVVGFLVWSKTKSK